ncbi:MAG: hypothetical protein ACRCYS_17510 [Beijerinckiaceae bacterium]
MDLPDCPFCGIKLQKHRNGFGHPVSDCYESGVFIGDKRIHAFNRRSARASLFMQLEDGHPVFNQLGLGRPVDIQLINATLAYYRSNSK